MFFECVGGWQLARFKRDPANRGTVLNTGLWRYTRHPNYFGDACVWSGLFAISYGSVVSLAAIFSPAVMTLLLAAGSGKPITERQMASRPRMNGAGYISGPWLPKDRAIRSR